MEPHPSPEELLTQIYGEATARNHRLRLESLLSGPTTVRSEFGLSERDALLITYADQIQEPGRAPLQTLADFAERHWKGVFSGVHILPFYPSTSDDGFSVQDYLAVDPALGTWTDVRRLGRDFDLMFDAVFNHLSAKSDWFKRFCEGDPGYQDFFVTVEGHPDLSQVIRPRALPLLTDFVTSSGNRRVWTTFSADQVDLNFHNPEVLFAVLEVLLFYVRQDARFIRLDAIAFLWKEIGTTCLHRPQTHAVIQLFRAVLRRVAPHVCLITETNVPHADNVSYFGDGTNEAQLVYNFALPPLVLHSLTTGRATALTHWAQQLRLPSTEVTFFNFLASHDGIGINPVRGILTEAEIEALVTRSRAHGGFVSDKHLPDGSRVPYELNINWGDALSEVSDSVEVRVRRLLCSFAIQLALQGVPGLYFHSAMGSRGDREGALRSGIPRRINREKLPRERLEEELAEAGSERARVWAGLKDLLSFRRRHSAFSPRGLQRVLLEDERIFAVERTSPDGSSRVNCWHNVSAHVVTIQCGGGELRLGPWEFRWEPSLA